MLCDADAVGIRHFGDSDPGLSGGTQIDMVRADAGCDRQLQVLCFGDPFGREIGGPEGLGDHDIGIGEFALKDRTRSVLVRGNHQGVTGALQECPQAELPGHAPEQLARHEVNRFRRWHRLAARIGRDNRDRVTGVLLRVTIDWVVVEHAKDLHHRLLSLDLRCFGDHVTRFGVTVSWPGLALKPGHLPRDSTGATSSSKWDPVHTATNKRSVSHNPQQVGGLTGFGAFEATQPQLPPGSVHRRAKEM